MEKKKRKKLKKLSLTKETLRGLDSQETRRAAAGVAPTVTCANSGCRSCHTCICP